MSISVQQLAGDEVRLFWLQIDWRKVEVLRKSGVGPIKICLEVVVKEIVDLYNWSTILIFQYFPL